MRRGGLGEEGKRKGKTKHNGGFGPFDQKNKAAGEVVVGEEGKATNTMKKTKWLVLAQQMSWRVLGFRPFDQME